MSSWTSSVNRANASKKLSRIEHDLIKEVHPQVGEIKEGMEEMIAAVKEIQTTILSPASKIMGISPPS